MKRKVPDGMTFQWRNLYIAAYGEKAEGVNENNPWRATGSLSPIRGCGGK